MQLQWLTRGALLAGMAMGSAAASAATIRDDGLDISYTALSALPQYSASGYITVNTGGSPSLGSGTLIASNWVLTAAHMVTRDVAGTQVVWSLDRFSFGQGTARSPITGPYTAAEVIVAAGWNGNPALGNDLALIRLTAPIAGATPAPLYNATTLGTEKGQAATVVGYSYNTGTGLTGGNTATSARRAATNVVDAFGGEIIPGSNAAGTAMNSDFTPLDGRVMLTDFDSPDNGTSVNRPGDPSDYYNLMGGGDPTAVEGAQIHGDSGGGLFIDVAGTTYLAGVTSFVDWFDNTPMAHAGKFGMYGDLNGFMRVSPHLAWINASIPEPGGAAVLMGLGLWNLTGRGRRRRSSFKQG